MHPSTLVGNPSEDIRKVLRELERFLNPPSEVERAKPELSGYSVSNLVARSVL